MLGKGQPFRVNTGQTWYQTEGIHSGNNIPSLDYPLSRFWMRKHVKGVVVIFEGVAKKKKNSAWWSRQTELTII
jgi:hypothetical protein